MESATDGAHTFLVEHYWPGVRPEVFRAAVDRLRSVVEQMAVAGAPLKFLHSTFVPEDENALCVFSSPTRQIVEEAYHKAGVAFERVLPALELHGGAPAET